MRRMTEEMNITEDMKTQDDYDSERTETDRSSEDESEQSESESEKSPKEQKEKDKREKPIKDWPLLKKIEFIKQNKMHSGLGVSASYLDKVHWSPKLKIWLYYFPNKAQQIISNLNRRLIKGSRKTTKDAPPTALSAAGLKLRTSGNSFVFLTQTPAEIKKDRFIKEPDDFITKFLGMHETKENLDVFREKQDLSKIFNKDVSVEEQAIKIYARITHSTPLSKLVYEHAHKRKRIDDDKNEKVADAKEELSVKKAKMTPQAQAKPQPRRKLLLTTSASLFRSSANSVQLNSTLHKGNLTLSLDDEVDEIQKAADEAKKQRLQMEAEKHQKLIAWISDKLDPKAWSLSKTGVLERKLNHPTSTKLTKEIIVAFCEETDIYLNLKFKAIDCTIECRSKTKDADVAKELLKLHCTVQLKIKMQANETDHSLCESLRLGGVRR